MVTELHIANDRGAAEGCELDDRHTSGHASKRRGAPQAVLYNRSEFADRSACWFEPRV